MPAHNERFGASGAVTPQTNRTKNAKSYSAEKSWNAPPAPSRQTLCASGRQCAVEQEFWT